MNAASFLRIVRNMIIPNNYQAGFMLAAPYFLITALALIILFLLVVSFFVTDTAQSFFRMGLRP